MITGLLASAGSKVPARWLTGIVLPGVLLALTITCVHGLGWVHAFDYAMARAKLTELLAAENGQHGSVTLLAIAIVAGGTAAGFVADVASHAVSAAFLRFSRPGHYVRTMARGVGQTYGGSGDYLGIDLRLAWPRIWLLCPDAARREIQAAWDQYGTATLLASWGCAYLLLGLFWPPSLIAGAVLLATAYWQASRCVKAFADLVIATVDITIAQLAVTLGVAVQSGAEIDEGHARTINELLIR